MILFRITLLVLLLVSHTALANESPSPFATSQPATANADNAGTVQPYKPIANVQKSLKENLSNDYLLEDLGRMALNKTRAVFTGSDASKTPPQAEAQPAPTQVQTKPLDAIINKATSALQAQIPISNPAPPPSALPENTAPQSPDAQQSVKIENTQASTVPALYEQLHKESQSVPVAKTITRETPENPLVKETVQAEKPARKQTAKESAKRKSRKNKTDALEQEDAIQTFTDDTKGGLSAESKKILELIGGNLKAKQPTENEASQKLNIQRDDFDSMLSGYENPARDNIGIKVSVNKNEMDVDRKLTAAYSAYTSQQFETAIALYKDALRIDSRSQSGLLGLASAYQKSGQNAQARRIYGRLLEIYPGNQDAINNFLVLISEEDADAALAHIESLSRLDDSSSALAAQMAMIHYKKGNINEAIKALSKAASLSPDNVNYIYNLAVLWDIAGNKSKAMELYRQLIELYHQGSSIPGNVNDIQERLTYLGSN